MEVCEATSITGQGFTDTAYFHDVYLREQLTDVKQHLPTRDCPYSVTQQQHLYETASNFSLPQINSVTAITPSIVSPNHTFNSLIHDSHRNRQHRSQSTLQTPSSTYEQLYSKETSANSMYTQHYCYSQQRNPSQHFLPQSNVNEKNIISDYKVNQFKFMNETIGMTSASVTPSAVVDSTAANNITTTSVTPPYTAKNNFTHSIPISEEKQDYTLNGFNLCNTVLLNSDANISQWDVNDPKLPKIRQFDLFTMWPQGHCRYAYKKSQSEGARRHASGWAMRNTNNHNSQILKKSCLGVLLCTSKQCTLAMRPAICDKARRRQEGRQCCMPNCNGRIYIQSCHGHGGYPVTHFWREHGDTIYFQAKGTHDHIRPDLKPVRDTAARRRKQQQQQQQVGQTEGRDEGKQRCTKGSRLHHMKSAKPIGVMQRHNEEKASVQHSNHFSFLESNTTISNQSMITPTTDYNDNVRTALFHHINNSDQFSNQFSQTHYNRKRITERDLDFHKLTPVDSSYCEIPMNKEPIFPGSNPFDTNDYSISTTLGPGEMLPTTISNSLTTTKDKPFTNNLSEINRTPSSQFSSPIISQSSVRTLTNNNQPYDDSLKVYSCEKNPVTTTTTHTNNITTNLVTAATTLSVTYTASPTEKYNSMRYNQQDPMEINNSGNNNYNCYQGQQINLSPTKISTSACNSFYRYHFMNQLLMNSQMNPINTTYGNNMHNHSSNSNTCGTNSESTSTYGLNASWSTPSPPTFGGVGGNSSLLSHEAIHNGMMTDEIPLHNHISSDSLKDLQTSLLNNLQEVNNSVWIDQYDSKNVCHGNITSSSGINSSIMENSSTYYDSINQQVHFNHQQQNYSTYMHKLNLAGYHLTTPHQQYGVNTMNTGNFSPLSQTGLTPSLFMSSSTPVSTTTSKTIHQMYSLHDNYISNHAPPSRLKQLSPETEADMNSTNNNNLGFSYIPPIPFYINSSSDSRSTRTDSSGDSSQSKHIML
ncbi:Transcription factor glial cells missing [Schistosoma japonicum]|nr:Transcription factor glial cells missing [Schistosoma japonicum]